MIVVDASVIIALLDANDAHHARAAEVLDDLRDPLAASALTVAEVLVGPANAGRLTAARSALATLEIAAVPIDDAMKLLIQNKGKVPSTQPK